MSKSICYKCNNRSTRCHTVCRAYIAETAARLHNKKQRAIESAGEYYNGLGTKALKTKIADRAGGRI